MLIVNFIFLQNFFFFFFLIFFLFLYFFPFPCFHNTLIALSAFFHKFSHRWTVLGGFFHLHFCKVINFFFLFKHSGFLKRFKTLFILKIGLRFGAYIDENGVFGRIRREYIHLREQSNFMCFYFIIYKTISKNYCGVIPFIIIKKNFSQSRSFSVNLHPCFAINYSITFAENFHSGGTGGLNGDT